MSKWIDIDDISLLKTVSVGGLSAKALWKRIRQQPSIDLVTCAECKHSDWYKGINGEWRCYCTEHGSSGHKADDFCSYGCRKESE